MQSNEPAVAVSFFTTAFWIITYCTWKSTSTSGLHAAEHRRVVRFKHLPVAEIHMHPTRQTWVEAPYRPHDVDALEIFRPILLEDRRILHRVLVRTRRTIAVAGICVPRGGRIGVVVGDLVILDHYVMRQHATHCFVEAAANSLIRNREVVPGSGSSGMQLRQRLLGKVKRRRGCISLKIRASAVPLDRIAPLRNL